MADVIDQNPNKIILKDDAEDKKIIDKDPKDIHSKVDDPEEETHPIKTDPTDPKTVEEKELIEIDGKQYEIDTDGNATLNGEVVYTKEQIDKMSETDYITDPNPEDDDTVAKIEDIAAKSGIVLTDKNGNAIQYDMSIDGLAKREIDVYNKGVADAQNNAIEQFLKANPDISDIVAYKMTYGTVEGYTRDFDYSKVQLDKNNKTQLKEIIVKAEIAKGNSAERAHRIANLIEADNTLDTEAEDSLAYLKSQQIAQAEINMKALQERERQQLEQQERFYGIGYDNQGNAIDLGIEGSIYDLVVKKGSVKGLQIPEAGIVVKTQKGDVLVNRVDLYNYISVPVKEIDGMWYTQAQLDDMARMNDPEVMVLNYIRNLTGDDMSQLVKKAINRDKVLTVRKLTSKGSKSQGTKRAGDNEGSKDKVILPVK